jgi:hypothetical protein
MKGILSYEDVVVTDAVRIPIGKFGGSLKDFEVYWGKRSRPCWSGQRSIRN